VLVTAAHVADGCGNAIRVIATDSARDIAIAEALPRWAGPVLFLDERGGPGPVVIAGAADGGNVVARETTFAERRRLARFRGQDRI
jgi:hypothetical protein